MAQKMICSFNQFIKCIRVNGDVLMVGKYAELFLVMLSNTNLLFLSKFSASFIGVFVLSLKIFICSCIKGPLCMS